ncbi:MAG: cell envelope integrity protein TolA [Gammaproteobacteria bacterium]|nr:MAG: cell envelope integrity protein TolA [Gammaproteobacteria bacterium]
MGEFVREYGISAVIAAVAHALLFALLLVGIGVPRQTLVPVVGDVEVMEAVVIEQAVLDARERRSQEAEAARQAEVQRQAQAAERRQAEVARQEAARREQAERERLEQLAREQAQAEASRRQAEEAQRAREEAERQAREETERRAREEAERRAREEAERRAREEAEQRAREEAERRAREEAERRAREQEARRQAERESELRRMMEGEERRRRAEQAGLLDQYRRMIEQRIVRNWARPPSAQAGLNCTVNVRQAPGGTVLDVSIGACNGDEAVRRSIEAAVYRASPLPEPPDPTLFERNLTIIFRPEL